MQYILTFMVSLQDEALMLPHMDSAKEVGYKPPGAAVPAGPQLSWHSEVWNLASLSL